ncbi:MAG: SGNH/GDSL hydrolase family protein [Gordonia sp. (in: high G+C Gram-positive bacteria)]|uniref:SGNH/GDSL hydrolase family protein n=1 Tax=Gordonia sp. (in: high G+C Gram-positive bacteria) TaxID=84139 RepID=UPI0039E5E8FB
MSRLARWAAPVAALAVVGVGAATAPTAHAAPDLGKRGARYVSIGDSYVAAGSNVDNVNVTRGCSQAPDDVGHLVARRMPGTTFADWACSGADTDDIVKNTSMGPQVHGLGPATRYVSVSIGGNDEAIFGDLVDDCLIGSKCTPQVKAKTFAKIERLGTRLDGTYAAIRSAAPNAKVVVVGYLRVLPKDPRGCFIDALTGRANVAFANRAQTALNDTIRDAAGRAGFTAVNIDQKPGHDMCAPDGRRYVSLTGFGPGDEGTPIHPTITGRRHVAGLIASAFKS